jgi:hypothetical protein
MPTVSTHQQAVFTVPVNGTAPVDADEVRLNDNATVGSYNAHDADATIHVQSSTLALRPAFGLSGRLWFTSDERKLYFDSGTAWQELQITGTNISGGTIPTSTLPVVPVAKGGTGLSTTPTNGQVPIGNGTGFTLAEITAGANVLITNYAGQIIIDAVLSGSGVSGTGTTSFVPRWVNSFTIGNGVLRDDGSYVAINTGPDPAYRLKVNGTAYATVVETPTANVTTANIGTANITNLPLNGLTYTWPSTQTTNFVLTTNGAGTLRWAPASTGPLNLISQTNYGGF